MSRFDPFAQSLGIAFVPISAETKKPYHEDWPRRAFVDADFGPTDSVGGIWGERSKGLTDLDADTIEAGRITRAFLTKGPQWGSPKKPFGHTLVLSPGTKTKKFISPFDDKPTIIEIRSTGSQSVLPPSPYSGGGH